MQEDGNMENNGCFGMFESGWEEDGIDKRKIVCKSDGKGLGNVQTFQNTRVA